MRFKNLRFDFHGDVYSGFQLLVLLRLLLGEDWLEEQQEPWMEQGQGRSVLGS